MKYTSSAKLLGISEKWPVWLIALLSLFITTLLYSVRVFLFISVADPWHFGRIRIGGSVCLTYGSGSRSCYFRHWFSTPQQKTIDFLKYIYIIFQRKKKSQNRRNQGFSYYFCLMIEGAGADQNPEPGGPKHIGILRIWIRPANTDSYFLLFPTCQFSSLNSVLRKILTEGLSGGVEALL